MHHGYLGDPTDSKHARTYCGWPSGSHLVTCVRICRSSFCDILTYEDGGDVDCANGCLRWLGKASLPLTHSLLVSDPLDDRY